METWVVISKCGVTRAEVGGVGADIEFLHFFRKYCSGHGRIATAAFGCRSDKFLESHNKICQ